MQTGNNTPANQRKIQCDLMMYGASVRRRLLLLPPQAVQRLPVPHLVRRPMRSGSVILAQFPRPEGPDDAAVTSTTGTLLPAAEVLRVTPGQRVSAISNDAGTFSLSITELTD